MSDVMDEARAGTIISGEALERLSQRPVSAEEREFNNAAAEAKEIWDQVGDISDIKMPLNRILVAIWIQPEVTSGGIIVPQQKRDEDVFQGVSGLVIKMGPHCYEQSASMDYEWLEEDRCKVGDWVMFRRGDGIRVDIRKRQCMLMDSERGIKMVLPRPNLVF